jgi:P-type E1-E2 ATPase
MWITWGIHQGNTKEIILHSLDIVTFVVPPMLPAALTATTSFAQRRLREKKIFCLSAKHISLSGGVDVACFDKVFQSFLSIENQNAL